ncbi:MAG: ABC transporter ATP-binding protein [Mangrovibacterium sp.]
MHILSAKNIIKDYNGHRALNDVSINVEEGSIFGLLGPNGAGKTTLIRIINQITAPDSGTVNFMGKSAQASDVQFIGYLPEERGLYKKMKVGEQALYLARLKGMSKNDALRNLKYWFQKFEIEAWWGKRVEELSKGMAQKVQFITTVIHNPKLLIFDEPFSGFDPINTNLIKEEILKLKEDGISVIFSAHNMASVEEICDHVALINRSKKILDGNIYDIKTAFKQGVFELEIPAHQVMPPTLNREDLIIMDDEIRANRHFFRFKKKHLIDNRALIELLNAESDILSFSEVLPSMNDVFIQAVEQSNHIENE